VRVTLDGRLYANTECCTPKQVRVWSVARSPEEIALQMHDTLPWETPDVMIYFRFDGQMEHKAPKVCAEYFGIKGKVGCDSSVVDGGAPSLVSLGSRCMV